MLGKLLDACFSLENVRNTDFSNVDAYADVFPRYLKNVSFCSVYNGQFQPYVSLQWSYMIVILAHENDF
jgi:hypothetical protein